MLLVTFHGGTTTSRATKSGPVNNVWAYDETNPTSPPTQNILNPGSETLQELRGLTLANGYIYVVNGSKDTSNVLCFSPVTGESLQYSFESVFVASSSAIKHPFSCTYSSPSGSSQLWYVSDQDSNIVAVLSSSSPYTSASAANCSSSQYLTALQTALANAESPIAGAGYLPGTFIPTAQVAAEIPPQIVVAPGWGGLSCTLTSSEDDESESESKKDKDHGKGSKSKQKVQNSVRDVIIANRVLYVADEAGNAVRMYDAGTGVPLGSTAIPSPIHFAVRNGNLYVGSGDSVYSGALVSEPTSLPALPSATQFSSQNPPLPYPAPPSGYTGSVTLGLTNLKLNIPSGSAVSGITFDDSGNMYLALRKGQAIYQFPPDQAKGNPLFSGLPDQPEFVLWT
jgi:hypothetical protein